MAIDNPKYDRLFRKTTPIQETNQEQYWFDQVTDHYNYDSTQATTWKQRYWVIDQFWNPRIGPIFLFICGEYVCNGVPEYRTWVTTLA
mgnify:CR=1 FL=1